VRRFLFALVTVVLLSGCGPVDSLDPTAPDNGIPLTPATLAGTWQDARHDATFSFAADGTFTATNLPYQLYLNGSQTALPGFDPAHDRIDDHGTWTLTTSFPGESPPTRLVLVKLFVRGSPRFPLGFGGQLNSWRQPDGGGGLVLEMPDTSSPGGYVYRKVANPTPS